MITSSYPLHTSVEHSLRRSSDTHYALSHTDLYKLQIVSTVLDMIRDLSFLRYSFILPTFLLSFLSFLSLFPLFHFFCFFHSFIHCFFHSFFLSFILSFCLSFCLSFFLSLSYLTSLLLSLCNHFLHFNAISN